VPTRSAIAVRRDGSSKALVTPDRNHCHKDLPWLQDVDPQEAEQGQCQSRIEELRSQQEEAAAEAIGKQTSKGRTQGPGEIVKPQHHGQLQRRVGDVPDKQAEEKLLHPAGNF
jgi:hypothetical protein